MIFSADETTDIGQETGTTVTPDYTARTAGSPARSTGSSSTPAPTTTTTSSTPRNASASPWPGSRHQIGGRGQGARRDRGNTIQLPLWSSSYQRDVVGEAGSGRVELKMGMSR